MSRKTMFLFSGQGSQYYQMGRQLHEQNPTFRACMDQMDQQAGAALGTSIVQTLYGANGKAEPFEDIRLTHPAIFMVEYALARTLIANGIRPDATLGASLGTVAALVIAGRMTPDDGLDLVLRQGLAVEKHCPRGGMIAVLAEPRLHEESAFLQARSVVAGRNFASHFVLSAPQDNLAAIKGHLARTGLTFQALPVQYPFHAPWIEPLREALLAACGTPAIRSAGLPVVCCEQGGFLEAASGDYFWQVARREIDFIGAVAEAERSGPFDYLDLGPSGTLSTFLKYLLPPSSGSRSFAVMTPFGRDSESLAAVRARCGSRAAAEA
jgi:bacillaene synthase trans-acting acyltransferase